MTHQPGPDLRYGTPAARWTLAATVLGSGMAFLDGTVVNVALPAIGRDLGTSFTGLQWTVNAYLVTLTALLLLGGSLGDRLGRRTVFVWGLGAFTVASVVCGFAPGSSTLIVARAVQGVGGALLVPGSLAIIGSVFHPEDRGRAIGAWSGLAGVATSIGPFLGGWLVDAVSWRAVFFINVPLAAVAIVIALRYVPDTRADEEGPVDVPGAVLATLGLAGVSYAAIEHDGIGALVAGLVGGLALLGFLLVEHRRAAPMMPLGLFRSRQFSGTNLTTLAVYAGLGGATFLVVIRLQASMGYSALEAGAALVPLSVLLLLFSPASGQLGQRIGPRIPLTIGPIIAGAGVLWLGAIGPGDGYVTSVLPAVVVFGIGMTFVVAPLTAAVLASVDDQMTGVASGVNNAVARLAGLLAVAALPGMAGIATGASLAEDLAAGYSTALQIAAAVTAAGGVVGFLLVSSEGRRRAEPPSPASLSGGPRGASDVT